MSICNKFSYQVASAARVLAQLVREVSKHNSKILIIHEENSKKNLKRVVSLYVIDISLDLHKF
jgi:phosphotransferase system HPr-like phosphotransfer protein